MWLSPDIRLPAQELHLLNTCKSSKSIDQFSCIIRVIYMVDSTVCYRFMFTKLVFQASIIQIWTELYT